MFKNLAPGCSNGKILKSFETAGFIMTEVAYSPLSSLSPHAHENAHFCFVVQGRYTESHNRQEFECRPLSLTFRPSGELHEDKFHSQEVRVFTIEIPPRWIERLRQDSIRLERALNFQCGAGVTRLSERIFKEVQRADFATALTVEGLTLEMMAETARYSATALDRKIPFWLERAKDLLYARFTENLSLDEIASAVGVHPVHLASVFRRKYHCTVGEYIRRLRIDFACREIKKGDAPLADIALEAGFANQGHFSSTFKRLTGFTPAAYRKFSRRS
jgi:AraC family transcriptional regulator